MMDDGQLRSPIIADEVDSDVVRARRRKRAILWMTLACWAANTAAFTLANVLMHSQHTAGLLGMRILLAGFGLLLCFGIYAALRKLRRRSLWVRAIALAIMAPLAAETFSWATYFGFSIVNQQPLIRPIDWAAAIPILAMWSWFFVAWAALCMALEYSFDVKDEEFRASEFMRLAQAAKVRALYNQVNPHFLFNSLNSISALIMDKRLEEADRMVELLAAYFRKTIALDPNTDVRLIDEIRLQQEYLAIEQARYPDLVVEVDVPSELEAAAVPALLLQPLVENAVKHGVARAAPPARIAIRARRNGDELELSVENHGVPASGKTGPEGAHIGLQNVRERLYNRFGERQELQAAAFAGGGFCTRIRMPMEPVR